jgi:hypothetical protein
MRFDARMRENETKSTVGDELICRLSEVGAVDERGELETWKFSKYSISFLFKRQDGRNFTHDWRERARQELGLTNSPNPVKTRTSWVACK